MEIEIDRSYLGCFGSLKKRRFTDGVVVHHTCTATPKATRRALQNKSCSTNFEVDRDGKIYQYAELDRQCAHCGSNNHRYLGVDLTHPAGADWPRAQVVAAGCLFRWLAEKLDIPFVYYDEPPRGFRAHRSVGNTECPQDFPYWEIFGGENTEGLHT